MTMPAILPLDNPPSRAQEGADFFTALLGWVAKFNSSTASIRELASWMTSNGAAAVGAFGLDCTSEVAIAATVSLDASAFGRMHVCGGTAADYTVDLPAPSESKGKLIGIRVSVDCTKMIQLVVAAGTGNIDGATNRWMWAGESAILSSNGAYWTKLAGKTIPMRARIYQGVAQAIPTGALTKTSLSQANYDIGYLSDIANYQVKIRRDGYYQVTGTATFANAISYQHYVTIDGSNIITTATSANNGYSPPATGTLNLSAGAAIAQGVYQGTGSSQNTYVTAFPCSLTVIEVPTW